MSVIFFAKGHIVYESREAFQDVVEWLCETSRMDEELRWTNGTGKPFSPNRSNAIPEYNCIEIPKGYNYRNFSVKDDFKNVHWARLALFTWMSHPYEVTIYDADGVTERVIVKDWISDNYDIEPEGDLDWAITDFFDQFEAKPPEKTRTQMRLKRGHRDAKKVKNGLSSDGQY